MAREVTWRVRGQQRNQKPSSRRSARRRSCSTRWPALVTLAVALFALVSFVSFQPGEAGPISAARSGTGLSTLLMQAFGLAVFLLPLPAGPARRAALSVAARRASPSRARSASLTLLLSLRGPAGAASGNTATSSTPAAGSAASSPRCLRDACGTLGAVRHRPRVLVVLAVMFATGIARCARVRARLPAASRQRCAQAGAAAPCRNSRWQRARW